MVGVTRVCVADLIEILDKKFTYALVRSCFQAEHVRLLERGAAMMADADYFYGRDVGLFLYFVGD